MPAIPASTDYLDAETLIVALLFDMDATVQQIGATLGPPFVVEESQIQVDVRAKSKTVCRDLAYEARSRLLAQNSLPNGRARVRISQGPYWFPEPDGEPRYVTTFLVASRAILSP